MPFKQGGSAFLRPLLREARNLPISPRCACHRRHVHSQQYSVIDTISGIDSKKGTGFRRHEDKPPPHLPLPPTLPYQPTSTPFRRHLQILEESLLSSASEPSWEIFQAIHEDLRRRHVPADTMRSLLAKQVSGLAIADRKQSGRWRKVNEIMQIMEENGICGKSEDLDKVIVAAIDAQGRRVAIKQLNISRLRAVWNDLVSIHADRLQNISLTARERWLLLQMSRPHLGSRRSHGTDQERLSAVRNEWHRLASMGFFKNFTVSENHLQVFRREYLHHIEEILATLRTVQQKGGIVSLETLLFAWRSHLDARISVFEPPDPALYRFIDDTLSAKPTAAHGSFDFLLRKSLEQAITEITGNIPVTVLSLYLPSDKTIRSDSDRVSLSDLQRALDVTRRRLKQIPTQPTESQTSIVVSALGFGVLLVEEVVAKGAAISDSFVLNIFRGFKYLPPRIRMDERHAPRLHSALLLLLRSLRRQDNSLKRWISVWPNMLEALAFYAPGNRDLLSHTMVIYRQMQSRKDPEHLKDLSAFREDFARKTLDVPWISSELYVDAMASGSNEDLATRESIVFRISTMRNPGHFRRLRSSITRYTSDRREPIIASVLEEAIRKCESAEHALKLYDILYKMKPDSERTLKALGLLLEKTRELGDSEQRQQAVIKAEEAYSHGVCFPRSVWETLAELVQGEMRDGEMDSRIEMIEAALRDGKRLYVA